MCYVLECSNWHERIQVGMNRPNSYWSHGNGTYCHNEHLTSKLLPVICEISGELVTKQWNKASHTGHSTKSAFVRNIIHNSPILTNQNFGRSTAASLAVSSQRSRHVACTKRHQQVNTDEWWKHHREYVCAKESHFQYLVTFHIYAVFRKKHPLTFSFLSPWMMCGFANCSEYMQRKVDSDNVEIRYSLLPMT